MAGSCNAHLSQPELWLVASAHDMILFGVVSDFLGEAIELFPTWEQAEAVVQAGIGTSPTRPGIDDSRH